MGGMPGDAARQRVLLMRHPETVANVEKYFSGRRDVALSKRGLAQRERAVEALVAFSPDRILTSPLSRARDLAQMAAERLQVPCVEVDDLTEIDFGPLEGMPIKEALSGAFPWPLDEFGRSMPAGSGESFEHLRERAERMVAELLRLEGRTACVTHGGFQRMFMAAVYGIPTERFWNQSTLNVSSLFFTGDGASLAMAGYNLTPEEVIAHSLRPSDYDTRDIWGVTERSNA